MNTSSINMELSSLFETTFVSCNKLENKNQNIIEKKKRKNRFKKRYNNCIFSFRKKIHIRHHTEKKNYIHVYQNNELKEYFYPTFDCY